MSIKEKVIATLKEKGYKVEEKIMLKNGIKQKGYVVTKEDEIISPVFYLDEMKDMSYESILNFIDKYLCIKAPFDISLLSDKEYILDHIYIGLQEAGNEDLIKRDCLDYEGLEEYLFLLDNTENGEIISIKVSDILLKNAGIAISKAWNRAYFNVEEDLTVTKITDVLEKAMVDVKLDTIPIYVFSNTKNTKGAASALVRDALLKVAEEYAVNKVIVLPSSIHEVLVMPYFDDDDIESYEKIVKTINATVVEPKDKLIDKVYIVTVQ